MTKQRYARPQDVHPADRPRQDGTWLFLFHIYCGPRYEGCIEAKNTIQAISEWAKQAGHSQDIYRAEQSTTVEPKKIIGKHHKE